MRLSDNELLIEQLVDNNINYLDYDFSYEEYCIELEDTTKQRDIEKLESLGFVVKWVDGNWYSIF